MSNFHKTTDKEINELISQLNIMYHGTLKWIDGVHVNKHSYLTFVDDEGYKYYSRVCVLKQNMTYPLRFHPSNIYTIDNIKLWISIHAFGYKILSLKYYSSKDKLCFQCDKGHIFYMNRDNFFHDQRCPQCNVSKGERRIKDYLIKNNIKFCEQQKYDNLIGIFGKNLSYDFFLEQYNLLIEYQGEFHDGNTRKQTESDKQRQQEHDNRKRQYAQDHGIKLLEIWYWDFDNIESILNYALGLYQPIKIRKRYYKH